MTTAPVVPPFLLHAGLVGPGVQISAPGGGARVGSRPRSKLTAESKLVDVSGPAVRARKQKRHRHLSETNADDPSTSIAACGAQSLRDSRSQAYSRPLRGVESRQILSRIIRIPQLTS